MLIDLIKANRSYRGYDRGRKVTKDELWAMAEAARWCPSSVNIQPLKYFLACTPDIVSLIQSETRWAKGLKDITLPHPGKEPPAFIVICQDTDIDPNLSRFQRDVGIAAQTMLLTAVEMGLGGCMIGNFNAGSLHDKLGLADNLMPLLIVAVSGNSPPHISTLSTKARIAIMRGLKTTHHLPPGSMEASVSKMSSTASMLPDANASVAFRMSP